MLTKKQQKVLDFIEKYQMKNGCSPTIREMREHFKVASDNSILKHLKKLEEAGSIQKNDRPRGIKPLDSVKERLKSPVTKIPLLGYIPAGGPVLADEYIEDYIGIGEGMMKRPETCFALRVTGESMINAGILEGDLVMADAKKEPRNGDIVIALIDGGNTVKRFIQGKKGTYLQAENEMYHDIYPIAELSIQGVVVGLLRLYD